jgi:hypothetical protein
MSGNDLDWAWMAGFFDGEGCIRVNEYQRKSKAKGGGPTRYQVTLVMHIVQVDRAPLDRVLRITGTGTVKPRKKWKKWKKNWQDSYEWIAGGSLQIKPVLEKLRSLCVLKSPQIDAALELLNSYGTRGCNGNQRLASTAIEERKLIVDRIKKLKKTRICDLPQYALRWNT